MEKIFDISSIIVDNGILIFIAVVFFYFLFLDRKSKQEDRQREIQERKEEKINNTAVLKELSTSNRNIAESLNLLKTSIDINTVEYRQHDERAIEQFNNINNKLIIIEEKLKK